MNRTPEEYLHVDAFLPALKKVEDETLKLRHENIMMLYFEV